MTRLVTGIGGLFFRSKDHKALAAWYQKNFGVNSSETGFIWQQDAGPTVFSPFKQDTEYFGNKEQQFMINFRVSNLDKLLEELKAAGVRTDPKSPDESFGKFAWAYDPDGNKIELWEPAEDPGK